MTPETSKTPTTFRNGEPIPPILYGTVRRDGKALPDVDAALELGYRGLDTASSRRFHQEPEDGKALHEFLDANGGGASLEGIFIQSKFGAPPGHVEPLLYDLGDDTKVRVLKSVLRSADDLGVDVIDTYFLHAPFSTIEGTVQAWWVLEELVSQGAVATLASPMLGAPGSASCTPRPW
jgi:diketogulonate reductase-like aldo/keto reductase